MLREEFVLNREKSPVVLQTVNGQKICEYAKVPFGWFSVGYNGCVLLGIYNALLLAGYGTELGRIRKCLHRFWRPRIFGVRSGEIARCLKRLGIPFRKTDDPDAFASAVGTGTVGIAMCWNRSVPFCHFTIGEAPLSVVRYPNPLGGAHGVAVTRDADGLWRVFNRFSNRSTVYTYRDFEEFCPYKTLFMVGYLIEKRQEAKTLKE